jgi:hypothetical protein
MPQTYFLGLDLGCTHDYSALVGLEQRMDPYRLQTTKGSAYYFMDLLKRWPLKTPYTEVVRNGALVVPRFIRPTLVID